MNDDKVYEFSPEKSHSENMQTSVSHILGQVTSLKKPKKIKRDLTRKLFCDIINNLVYLYDRDYALQAEFDMDMTKYDHKFFETFDMFMELHFTPDQLKIINFYLYDRFNDNGTITPLTHVSGAIIPLEDPNDLYNVIMSMTKTNEASSKKK